MNAPLASRWRRLLRVLGFVGRELSPHRLAIGLAFLALVLQRALALLPPFLTKFVVDDVLTANKRELLLPLALAFFAAGILQAAVGFFLARSLVRISEGATLSLRQKLHAHLLKTKIASFDTTRAGNLAHRVLQESTEIEAFAGPFSLEIAGAFLTALFAFALLIALSPQLTLIVCLLLLALVAISLATLTQAYWLSREQNRVRAELSGQLSESFAAIRTIKAFGTIEAHQRHRFGSGARELFAIALRGSKISLRLAALSTALFGALTALIVYLAASQVLSGASSLGEMIAFLAILAFFVAPLMQLVTMAPGLLRAASAMERTLELLDLPTEHHPARTLRPESVVGEIAFEDLSFAYGESAVLRDIGFRAHPGQVIALVGPSGAGKSTILSLLAGFYEPSSGRVLIDGHDLGSMDLAHYRQFIAIVPQEPLLFEGTVLHNIALARPSASEAEIIAAAREAGVDAFVEALPKGYETRVGERGESLSAGQRQRIAIARALLTGAPIVLLDEPTSALDAEAESWLNPIFSTSRERTTFLVSHRLSTILTADHIIVLDDGKIVEQGTHTSLLGARGRYYELYGQSAGLELERVTDRSESA